MKIRHLVSLFLVAFHACPAAAEPRELAGVEVEDTPRVAIEEPLVTYSNPVSVLRFEPLVDLQQRNLAEAQSDLTIRGGIFENSAIELGGSSIYDPQTGHYVTENPVNSEMLHYPEVRTGVASAMSGFNADVGTVHYEWKPITKSGILLRGGAGDHDYNVQDAYGKLKLLETESGTLNADFGYGRSESAGTRANGDHDFERLDGRLQWLGKTSQTDFFTGYQDKQFSWPYLYALRELHEAVGSSGVESEALKTNLFLLNHTQDYGKDLKSNFGFSSYYRRNKDDYELDKFNPGLFNPFQHETDVWSWTASGRHQEEKAHLNYNAQLLTDEIDSTSLTAGGFSSRTYYKLALLPGYAFDVGKDLALITEAGAVYNNSNRDEGRLSPLARVTLEEREGEQDVRAIYTEVSQTSQLPGYTALASSATSGLFRGNPNLDRSIATNYEVGGRLKRQYIEAQTAVFYRYDHDLTDWTYDSNIAPFASRSANNVDIGTAGYEAVVQGGTDTLRGVLGYTYLNKSEDYHGAAVDGSFYALNFAKHRITGALVYQPLHSITLRLDNEFRDQEDNALRDSSDTTYFISSVSATWAVPWMIGLEVSALVDNLGKENFEEVPGVPGAGRLVAGVVQYRWDADS